METGTLKRTGAKIKYSVLKDRNNHWMQFYYTIVPERSEQIADQIRTIEQAEEGLFQMFGIAKAASAVKHFFSSDLFNHHKELVEYKKRQNTDFYFALTEQPPVSCVKLALLGMCLSNITNKFREDDIFYFDTSSGIRHLFVAHLVDPNPAENSEEQAERIFAFLREKLSRFNTSIEGGVLRTWIYAPHVDADYPGIVKARKKLFDSIDLLSSFIIYLRDAGDYGFVESLIHEYSENLPAIYVKAPVCRPGWLIEIEATAGKVIR